MNFTPEEREHLKQKLSKLSPSTLNQLGVLLGCPSANQPSTPQVESKHMSFTAKERENLKQKFIKMQPSVLYDVFLIVLCCLPPSIYEQISIYFDQESEELLL